jgi:hypothetical protein
VAQAVKWLPSKHEGLSSNSSTANKQRTLFFLFGFPFTCAYPHAQHITVTQQMLAKEHMEQRRREMGVMRENKTRARN